MRVPHEAAQFLPGPHIPKPYCLVPATGEGITVVRGKGHSGNPPLMSLETAEFFPRLGIPQPQGLVMMGAGKGETAVGGKGYPINTIRLLGRVYLKAAKFLARLHLPQPHRAVPPPGGPAAVGVQSP